MKTKIFTLLFAIVASIGTICAKVKIGDLYYNFDDATMTASVTNALRFNGSTEYLTKSIIEIPETVNYNDNIYVVTSIELAAFRNCEYLESITIPNSITSIAEEVFMNCSQLTSIVLPNGITKIEDETFANCGLTSIVIGDAVTSIGEEAFYHCTDLESITIGSGMTEIDKTAFTYCSNLPSVTINSNIIVSKDYPYGGQYSKPYPSTLSFLNSPSNLPPSEKNIFPIPSFLLFLI